MPHSFNDSRISRVAIAVAIAASMTGLVNCDDDSNTGGSGGAYNSGGNGGQAGGKATAGNNSSGGATGVAGNTSLGGTSGAAGKSATGGVSTGGVVSTAGMPSGAGTSSASGSAGKAGGAGQAAASFATIYSSVIAVRCLGCHANGPGATTGMLDLSTRELAFNNLVGTSGSGVTAKGTSAGAAGVTCASRAGLLRVDPGDAASSLLWQKVNSKLQGTNPPCGNPMPPGTAAALTQTEVDLLAAWINQGAMNN